MLLNPDPARRVTFGEQTSEEMLFTFARFRFKGETTSERHGDWFAALQGNVAFGALDDNMDSKLTAAEFRNDPRFKPLVGYMSMVDTDKDNALSKSEMATALQTLRKMREQRAAPASPKEDAGAAAMRQSATGESP